MSSFYKTIGGDVKNIREAYQDLGVVGSFFTFFQGRATAFAILFSAVGIYGFLKHYDLTSFAMFVGAIFTGVVGHSIKEDYFQLRHRQLNQAEQRAPQGDGKNNG